MKTARSDGSEAEPRPPTQADPRSVVAQSRLEEDPRLKTMWAGYAFAKDFRDERGHAFMLDDQTYIERQQAAKQPGACLNCHASVSRPYKKAGDGDLVKGFEKFNQMPFAEARKLVTHPVACIGCHESDDATSGHAARIHGRNPREKSRRRRAELRCETSSARRSSILISSKGKILRVSTRRRKRCGFSVNPLPSRAKGNSRCGQQSSGKNPDGHDFHCHRND